MALLLTYSRGAALSVLAMLLLWALIRREKHTFELFIGCGSVFLVLLLLSPILLGRFQRGPLLAAFSAEYEPEFNFLVRRPNKTDVLRIRVRNTGTTSWTAGDQPVQITNRWYDALNRRYIGEAKNYISIATSLKPSESVTIPGSFTTPATPGTYLMTWDILYPGRGWFSGDGIYPGLVEVHVETSGKQASERADLSRWLRPDVARLFVANVPPARGELWYAALRLAEGHPILGLGPDNFRLLYGKQLGLNRWDTKIRSNSLYLELLSGSGLAGLAAFCAMMIATRWNSGPLCIALGIFLTHGMVDAFLMTTPIYFAFWILLGQIQCTSSVSITHSKTF
jgi:hypothetical protein